MIATLPAERRARVAAIKIEIADLPDPADLAAVKPPFPPTILGLYRGPVGRGRAGARRRAAVDRAVSQEPRARGQDARRAVRADPRHAAARDRAPRRPRRGRPAPPRHGIAPPWGRMAAMSDGHGPGGQLHPTTVQSLDAALQREQKKVALVQEVSRALSETGDLDTLLRADHGEGHRADGGRSLHALPRHRGRPAAVVEGRPGRRARRDPARGRRGHRGLGRADARDRQHPRRVRRPAVPAARSISRAAIARARS